MKRKIALTLTLIIIACLLFSGCNAKTQAQINELNAKLEEAESVSKELALQLESANQQLADIKSEAEDTIARLQAAADASGFILQEVDNFIHISGVKYQNTYTDLPFYSTANEAKNNIYNIGYDEVTSFSIEELDKATDIVVTVISNNGNLFDVPVKLTPDNTYVFTFDFYPGVYTVEISYKINEVQTSIYFAPQFNF